MSRHQLSFEAFEILKIQNSKKECLHSRRQIFQNVWRLKVRIMERKFHGVGGGGGEKLVWIMKFLELWRFELWEVSYESFLRNFHGVEELCELWEVALQRILINVKLDVLKNIFS